MITILNAKQVINVISLDDLNGISACAADPQPGVESLCRASFPAFYYDKSRNKCIDFIYGGCRATNNLFGSLEDCEIVCMRKSGDSNEWTTRIQCSSVFIQMNWMTSWWLEL